jgi:pimeloyl-ACP methyl ester carboxylesterase
MDSSTATTADGRTLEYVISGPEDGPVLLFHHGTPGSLLQKSYFARAAHERGWRLLTYSRAGYGLSARAPNRTVADVVPDMRDLLDTVGVERVMVAGASGGGPHALACAALMPERTSVALTIAGAGPHGLDLDFLAGMGEDNVNEFGAALEGEQTLRTYLETEATTLRTATAEQFLQAMDSLLPDVDRAVLTGELGQETIAGLQYGIGSSIDGWLDDDLAFTRPWGFDLADIAVPTTIWQGDVDLMVPIAHGQWLGRNVPGARVHLETGQGHLSITVGAADRMLAELADLAGQEPTIAS